MLNQVNNSSVTGTSQSDIVSAIRRASDATGVDFSYLLEEAKAESSLNPKAQAASSTARGLYQFIESTWLEMVDRHGGKYGLDAEAAAISRDSKGRPQVRDPHTRQEILKLRENPHVSALMAAELAKDNKVVLERKLGREVTSAELYMAHFLGAGGAAKFLHSLDHNPDVEADYIVPAAARANQAVFYKGGKALTLNQVYARFENKFIIEEPGVMPPAPGFSPQQATLIAEATAEVLRPGAASLSVASPSSPSATSASSAPTPPASAEPVAATGAGVAAPLVAEPDAVAANQTMTGTGSFASAAGISVDALTPGKQPSAEEPLRHNIAEENQTRANQRYELAMSELASIRAAIQDSYHHNNYPAADTDSGNSMLMQLAELAGRQRMNVQQTSVQAVLKPDVSQLDYTARLNANTLMALSMLNAMRRLDERDDDNNEWIV